jgi:hypothetical protein
VTHERATSSDRTPDARDIVWPAGDAPLNGPLTPDPSGADNGPLPPIDPPPGDPRDENRAIDGLPGRYERKAQEDDEAGLDLTRVPLGESNA